MPINFLKLKVLCLLAAQSRSCRHSWIP